MIESVRLAQIIVLLAKCVFKMFNSYIVQNLLYIFAKMIQEEMTMSQDLIV